MDLVISQENRAIQKQPNFSELLEGFISYLDVSEASIRAYMKATKQFYIYIMEHGITEPTRQDVIGFREQLKTEGKKASTIQNYITGLRQFFKWTEGTGAYPNIAKDVKGVRLNHTHKKDYLTSRQVKNVLQGMERKTKIGKRNYAIVTLMLTGGLRTIEVSRANIEDIRTVRDQSVLGGMETWGGRRSAAYASMCGSLLPFSRRRGRVQALQNSAKAGGTHTHTREEAIGCNLDKCPKSNKRSRMRSVSILPTSALDFLVI